MARPKLSDLAATAGGWILMTFAAGLRVEKRTETPCNALHAIERFLVGLVCGIVNDTIARTIERRGCLIRACASSHAQHGAQHDPSHGTTS
jgi:hypothetical protein